ncbi:MAG: helix-turn-helix domain-containing protein [Phycisphaerales bacterium]
MVLPTNSAQTRSVRPDGGSATHAGGAPTRPVSAGEARPGSGGDPIETHRSRSVGVAIRERRRSIGLTLSALAERIGCAKSYLSQIETGVRENPPKPAMLRRIEAALGWPAGKLDEPAAWQRTPEGVRREIEQSRAVARRLRALFGIGSEGDRPGAAARSLDELHASGELRRLVDRIDPLGSAGVAGIEPVALPREVPLINRVAAGYPTEFTDLGYPARVADEYVRVPDLADPDAFAARVVGDSMCPEYREGDVVVFSPARAVESGCDCFARLEPDHETTFKRVFFETTAEGEARIRLQPLNASYPPRVLPRDAVAGLYRAVTVVRSIGE